MKDEFCIIEVGLHPGGYFRRVSDGAVFCWEHRAQMDEYHAGEHPGLPPIEWESCSPNKQADAS